MSKASQTYEWDPEPADERASGFMPSRLSEFASLDALDPMVRAEALSGPRAFLAPEAKRAPPSGSDVTLSALVPGWLESLLPEAWPGYLCQYFPRIANRLALCWADPELTVRLLDEFFLDRRGTRRGFPAEALDDLMVLRKIAARRVGMKIV